MTVAPDHLFTYGTLKRGFDNPFAEKLRLISSYEGEGFFQGNLYQITWYPGAVYDQSAESKVHGEIYRLESPDILRELDEYEEVLENEAESLYLRKIIPVKTENGAEIHCWAYLYNQSVSDFPIIENGHFTG